VGVVNVILTIFVAGVVIFILWFLIVLRTGLPSADDSDPADDDSPTD
jgi:hypothetical protein